MTTPRLQREAIEFVLSVAEKQGRLPSFFPLHPTITTDRGTLFLLGVSQGQFPKWRHCQVAVYGKKFPGKTKSGVGSQTTVEAAVLLDYPQESSTPNKLEIELLKPDKGTSAIRTGITTTYLEII